MSKARFNYECGHTFEDVNGIAFAVNVTVSKDPGVAIHHPELVTNAGNFNSKVFRFSPVAAYLYGSRAASAALVAPGLSGLNDASNVTDSHDSPENLFCFIFFFVSLLLLVALIALILISYFACTRPAMLQHVAAYKQLAAEREEEEEARAEAERKRAALAKKVTGDSPHSARPRQLQTASVSGPFPAIANSMRNTPPSQSHMQPQQVQRQQQFSMAVNPLMHPGSTANGFPLSHPFGFAYPITPGMASQPTLNTMTTTGALEASHHNSFALARPSSVRMGAAPVGLSTGSQRVLDSSGSQLMPPHTAPGTDQLQQPQPQEPTTPGTLPPPLRRRNSRVSFSEKMVVRL